MSTGRSLAAVAVAALLFAAWEIVDHVLLMEMEMVTYHLIGFVCETVLAAAAILWATHHAERARRERERAERLAAVVATAIVSSEADISPVTRLMDGLAAVRRSTSDIPEVQETLRGMEEDARRIQVVSRGLRQIVSPHVQS
ncbi:MAG: hypothetical protein ACE5JM_16740 [Armatimonadota bacterium]